MNMFLDLAAQVDHDDEESDIGEDDLEAVEREYNGNTSPFPSNQP